MLNAPRQTIGHHGSKLVLSMVGEIALPLHDSKYSLEKRQRLPRLKNLLTKLTREQPTSFFVWQVLAAIVGTLSPSK